MARGSGRNTTGIYYVKARDASNYPKMHRTHLTTKNNLVQSISNTKVEKPFRRITSGGLGSLLFKIITWKSLHKMHFGVKYILTFIKTTSIYTLMYVLLTINCIPPVLLLTL